MGQIELNFRNILIVDLYDAIEKNDPSIVDKNLSQDQFEELVETYIEAQKQEKPTIEEKRYFQLKGRIEITTTCIAYLEQEPYDEDIWEILREHGWKIEKDTLEKDISQIIDSLQRLIDKKKMLDEEKKAKEKKKSDANYSIFEIIATMSAGLEGIYLDPKQLSVAEFLAYQRVLKEKSEGIERTKREREVKNGRNKR